MPDYICRLGDAMILSMMDQFRILFLSMLLGSVTGFIYDIFRIIRKVFKHSNLLIQLEDILFWLIATAVAFYFFLNRSYGEIRMFALLGTACGIVLYFATISRVVIKISVVVVNFVKRVIAAAVRIVLFPFQLFANVITPPAKKFVHNRRKNLRMAARYGKIQMKKARRSWGIVLRKW